MISCKCNVSFTGVTSQPASLNGDFESWQNQTISKPQGWYSQTGGNGNGISRTTDVEVGTYAIELQTVSAQNKNGTPRANSTFISTGYWPQNCNGNCKQQGGFPYSKMVDTLAFYYKYAPMHPQDSTWININFKKNGVQIVGRGMAIKAAANYTFATIPFKLSQYPDSVIIDIQSSNWKDTAISFIGANLKIDAIHFMSQESNISDSTLTVSASTLSVPNTISTLSVNVNATVTWKVSSNQSWLSVYPN